ncbi:Protein VAC14 [Grifola frondosa]|uniref:Protein VAC14 n=1 Tax=Grifola frondosa TaxID=5627 RepID=A0A1C7LZA1_GRIFR|nr:Protein VAC14 [Grifola frondosa]
MGRPIACLCVHKSNIGPDSSVSKQLVDKMYEKRKAAALELENQIVDQLVDMFSNPGNPLHVRNGGLIGLAGTAIALGVDIAPYMEKFVEPLLVCFTDPENRVRYFSAECLYNIAKVSKGEILVYFNPIFDALSKVHLSIMIAMLNLILYKLAADSELSVKNGAELLDRLLKDIVAETASVYIPQYPETEAIRRRADEAHGLSILVPHPDDVANGADLNAARKAFSLAHFIPLLSERIYVLSPFTRSYLVSWITVLDSVPELELITYLPEFLDGLLAYLSDPTDDVRVATENILADFLREIRDVTIVQRRHEEQLKNKRDFAGADQSQQARRAEGDKLPDITMAHSERAPFIPEHDDVFDKTWKYLQMTDNRRRITGTWVPGQGVKIDYAAIVEILIRQFQEDSRDAIQESTALRWLSEFLNIAQEVMVPFTARLIPEAGTDKSSSSISNVPPGSPTPAAPNLAPLKQPTTAKDSTANRSLSSPDSPPDPTVQPPASSERTIAGPGLKSRSGSFRESQHAMLHLWIMSPEASMLLDKNDQFDHRATVETLKDQLASVHEETRVAAFQWLIMLHQKAPKKILYMDDDATFQLLKILSDSSEEVIKQDLQLIAQISSSSDESFFKSFMINLLELFSTDRGMLDSRGGLIIRQLCLNLNTERIYRTFAEILEKEEDLEFASGMVQKLNIILITSPELADFRRRLKSLETRQDGQALFTTLYRSWCHNAVAVFSLCLLAQAYEHASNLLYIFADLEITVQLLVQIDKLVQLIESPVFTYIRLQLLEPEKYPHLFKCLYGLLMLLPQSSAFVSLRNRLNAVNSAGFLHIAPKSSVGNLSSTRSKLGREDIKWQELLSHFRSVQAKHEKARRQALGTDTPSLSGLLNGDKPATPAPVAPPAASSIPPPTRRKVAGAEALRPPSRTGGMLSPLNPRSRGQSGLSASIVGQPPLSPTLPAQNQSKARRALSLSRKT